MLRTLQLAQPALDVRHLFIQCKCYIDVLRSVLDQCHGVPAAVHPDQVSSLAVSLTRLQEKYYRTLHRMIIVRSWTNASISSYFETMETMNSHQANSDGQATMCTDSLQCAILITLSYLFLFYDLSRVLLIVQISSCAYQTCMRKLCICTM